MSAVRGSHPWEPPHSAASDACNALVMRRRGADACGLPRAAGVHVEDAPDLPLHRTEANYGVCCATCDGGGCLDCTDPS